MSLQRRFKVQPVNDSIANALGVKLQIRREEGAIRISFFFHNKELTRTHAHGAANCLFTRTKSHICDLRFVSMRGTKTEMCSYVLFVTGTYERGSGDGWSKRSGIYFLRGLFFF